MPRWRYCTAMAGCCPRMSACSWSGCDGETCGLDDGGGSDPLSELRGLRRNAVFPPRLLRVMWGNGLEGIPRERRGNGLRDVAGLPRGDTRDQGACTLQH